ncbi:MAG: hypothetical protein ACR652_10190 [Methylocystis sp.]|uniref:hypothetical protein n=1 Tax=Methylocystis sp. TaxID=1911079 RepID=UPI003DA4D6E2
MSDFGRLANMLGAAGMEAPKAMRRAINHTGDKARTQMTKALVPQTGLKYGILKRALKTTKANDKAAASGDFSYTISSEGGDIRLKFFSPRETRQGVTAMVAGKRTLFARTFSKGGRFPNRVGLPWGREVKQRAGSGRLPLQTVRSHVFIPIEMVRGESEKAFYRVIETDLAPRVEHELARILGLK